MDGPAASSLSPRRCGVGRALDLADADPGNREGKGRVAIVSWDFSGGLVRETSGRAGSQRSAPLSHCLRHLFGRRPSSLAPYSDKRWAVASSTYIMRINSSGSHLLRYFFANLFICRIRSFSEDACNCSKVRSDRIFIMPFLSSSFIILHALCHPIFTHSIIPAKEGDGLFSTYMRPHRIQCVVRRGFARY